MKSTTQRRTVAASVAAPVRHDYSALLTAVRESFRSATASGAQLFLTDAEVLWDIYLSSLPSDIRQEHNCHACRDFINRYGGLVTVSPMGIAASALWSCPVTTDEYDTAILEVDRVVSKARIVAPFYSKDAVWGRPETGAWRHLSVTSNGVWANKLMTAGQKMAAMKQSFKDVSLALSEPKLAEALDEVLRMLRSESLARSEKFLAPAEWLRRLLDRPKGRRGENLLWKAIAEAPEGFLHPRSSVIWPVVEAVKAGESFTSIKGKFDAMLGPLQYQRPSAAPTVGNIRAAEEAVGKLGIARSLERRYATIADVTQHLVLLWTPEETKPEASSAGGVFGHLKPRKTDSVSRVDLPAQTMTWDKFSRMILPVAKRLELKVPLYGTFIAMLTAVHEDAPLIFKWPNPLNWYVYPGGSPAVKWGLSLDWTSVTGVVPFPAPEYAATGAILLLEGAHEVYSNMGGNALFPETLNSELFPYRATIEAYSRGAVLAGREAATACGYDLRKHQTEATLRVDGVDMYRIDRWD